LMLLEQVAEIHDGGAIRQENGFRS
jgi:hypothetical protein